LIGELTAVVTEKLVGRQVTRDEEVGVTVVVHVRKQPCVRLVYSVEAGFSGHIGEFDCAGIVANVPVEA
jgi:hypothetical protein